MFQCPRAWISHLGNPAAAAVVAAPILNECDDMFVMCGGFILFMAADRFDLVRNRPSCQRNRGPLLFWCEER